jgi:hypothetical protein
LVFCTNKNLATLFETLKPTFLWINRTSIVCTSDFSSFRVYFLLVGSYHLMYAPEFANDY